eukprot:195254_1
MASFEKMDDVKPISIACGGVDVDLTPGLFIDNKFVKSVSKKQFPTLNPCNGKEIATIFEADKADVDLAVDAAEKAFRTTWRTAKPDFRARLLYKLADLMERDTDQLARLETIDNGKALAVAKAADLPLTIQCFRYYAGWADKIHGETINSDPAHMAFTIREPIGVCGCIIPWNFPLLMMAWKLAPLLACGNVAVLKTAEQTPLSALYVCKLMREAGFPAGVVNILSGYGPTAGAAISAHPRIRKVAFTGSTEVGKIVMKAAADSNLKKVSLELGGKSPNIIFEDADLDNAAKWSSGGIYFNHGQCCCAGSRIFVQESIMEKFMEKFAEHAKAIKIGDPFEAGVTQGPQIDNDQFTKIMDYIEQGKKDGAQLVFGGSRIGEEGFFIEPTLFSKVKEDMSIVREEIFGPVACVIPFSTEAEVLQKANDTEFGLAAAVFTKDLSRAVRVSRELQAGTVWVNCYNVFDAKYAFGGFKQSGIGRELGEYALELYTQVKQVTISL